MSIPKTAIIKTANTIFVMVCFFSVVTRLILKLINPYVRAVKIKGISRIFFAGYASSGIYSFMSIRCARICSDPRIKKKIKANF